MGKKKIGRPKKPGPKAKRKQKSYYIPRPPKPPGPPKPFRCTLLGCYGKYDRGGLCNPCNKHRWRTGGTKAIFDRKMQEEVETHIDGWVYNRKFKKGKYPNSLKALRANFAEYLNEISPGLGEAYTKGIRPGLWVFRFKRALPNIKLKGSHSVCKVYLNYSVAVTQTSSEDLLARMKELEILEKSAQLP